MSSSKILTAIRDITRSKHRIAWLVGGTISSIAGATYILEDKNVDKTSLLGFVRLGRTFVTVTSIVVDYKLSLFGKEPSMSDYQPTKNNVHLRSAKKLHSLCCKNGGVFIKLGQHLGALDYLLPEEYVNTLKVLHDDAPQSSLDDIKKLVAEDLGKTDNIFKEFSPVPIGTASLAQVHRATLMDGTELAVKVQHPKVKAYSEVDMKSISFLLNSVAWFFPEFEFLWLSGEMNKNLPLELDFVKEGKNAEKVEKLLSHFKFLKIPKVYWELTTERVLTMEYCEGGRVNDLEYVNKNNIDVNKVTRDLGKLYSEMIFVHGFVHCDPHPGNVLVWKDSNGQQEIILLDHGLYLTLPNEFRLNYANLWQSLIAANLEGIKLYSQRLGAGELYPLFACMLTARSWAVVTHGIDQVERSSKEDDIIKASIIEYFPQVSKILNEVPREMLLLFKTNDLLRGIEYALKIRKDASSFINMSRCCVRALAMHEVEQCDGWGCFVRVLVNANYNLFKIRVYELVTRFMSLPLMQYISSILWTKEPFEVQPTKVLL
ncbi:aarF domain-containing protein kinase 1-like [Anneissia japonica]|uniref:aarF domain-containing protein kinase 1-like n=1 Tax=Anneissia japonica TaxID=1529436 RepID=UPI001425B6CA|nr:aarF domain-containing protein kinase 1-like [Anneissia japonica]XP_033115858.1 aarF domain-containing protein kinase 1-like [Anneissia japonica]